MLPPPNLRIVLGPLFRSVADGAAWRDDPAEEYFPSRQYVADELERYFAFAVARGQFARFLPRLRARRSERDAAISELAVAFMFERDGFAVIEWEPPGSDQRTGEYRISAGSGQTIFVEVKGPGWEGELAPVERADRRKRPKYIHAEARFVDCITPIRYACDKALPKLTGAEPSLPVIADDLFLGYGENKWACEVGLYASAAGLDGYSAKRGPFLEPRFDVPGGVMVFWHDRREGREFDPSAFGRRLYINPGARDDACLPECFARAYAGVSKVDFTP